MKQIFIKGCLIVCCSCIWMPFLIILGNSFMSESEMLQRYGMIFTNGRGMAEETILPSYPTLKPYVELLMDSPGFFSMFWNSCFQSFFIVAGQSVVAVLAGWGFAMYEFPGKKGLFLLYCLLMVLPFQITMVPSYLVLNRMNLLDTHLAIILPAVFLSFPVFIITQFFRAIPVSVLEAAKIDGAGDWRIFTSIGLPLGLPGIMASGILTFLEAWNTIEQPMTFLKNRTLWPLSLYLPEITADNAGAAWAASVITMLPPLLLFLMGQSYLEQGIMMSGVKE